MAVFDIVLRETQDNFDITLGAPVTGTADLPKVYYYKISRGGSYLGLLPNVDSEFGYSQDINTPAAQMTIEVSDTPDVQTLPPEYINTEGLSRITTESGDRLTTERAPDIVGNLNSRALIRNNNDVEVYEFSPNYPNGKLVFSGFMSKWKAKFGTSDTIEITVLSHGAELDNYLIQGSSILDASQATGTDEALIFDDSGSDKGIAWSFVGESITVGASANNIASVIVKARAATSTPANLIVRLYDNSAFSGTPLATATLAISDMTAAEYTLTFSTSASVSPGQVVYMGVFTDGESTNALYVIYKAGTNAYAGGTMYNNFYGGGSGGGSWLPVPTGSYIDGSDLYFKTYFTAGATSSPFNSQDPTTMLRTIIDSYVARGGTIDYDGSSTQLTGVTRSYTFKVNTVLEGVKKVLDISPSDFYWYVDPATSIIYFKETATSAEHLMIYGRHVQSLEIEATVENLKNQVYFTGGQVGSENLYISQSDSDSIEENAGRIGLARVTDNRVTLADTATAVVDSILEGTSSEAYTIVLTVNDKDYDTKLFKVGQVVGFAGFSDFVDTLIVQIVRIAPRPDYITLTLGILPKRTTVFIEEIARRLTEVETVDNPDSPS